jgi:hypothetical protein
MDRICKICGVTSQTALFYKGVNSRCQECHKTKVRENRAEKLDYYRAYDAKRFQDDPRRAEKNRAYAKTEAGKRSMLASRQRWLAKHPAKRAAHIILGNAVSAGRISKPVNCQVCGAGGRIDGHHDDYTKPLDVIWCCRKCHVQIHKELDAKQ